MLAQYADHLLDGLAMLGKNCCRGSGPDNHCPDADCDSQVISAQANFMTVRVTVPGKDQHVELLCIVRALLKKLRERVLVGDYVRVISIDWVEAQG